MLCTCPSFIASFVLESLFIYLRDFVKLLKVFHHDSFKFYCDAIDFCRLFILWSRLRRAWYFLSMLDDIGFEDKFKIYCIRKMMTIAIRTSYYIFCCRNKEWSDPQLLVF